MDTTVCLHPVFLPEKGWVPCGKCPVCRMKYRKQMAIRIKMEQNIDKPVYSFFITLTYDETFIPKCKGRSCFSKEHVTTFLDSLKHRLFRDGYTYRHFLTCEYGEEGYRPHYHALLFLYSRTDFKCKHYPRLTPGHQAPHFYFNDTIVQPLWRYGFSYQGTVTSASILYCTSYALKDDEELEKDWTGFEDGKPFRRYSLRPGLGLSDSCLSWWLSYVYNEGDEIRTSVKVNTKRGPVASGIPVGVKRRVKEGYPDIYECLLNANARFMDQAQDKLYNTAQSFGPTKIYGRVYDPSSYPVFDDSVDREVIAFRKALRKMNKDAKRL